MNLKSEELFLSSPSLYKTFDKSQLLSPSATGKDKQR